MDKIIILDFGGQYCHLISRRIRDMGVYSAVMPQSTSKEELLKIPGLKGVILSGGAASVYDFDAPKCDKDIIHLRLPLLGICYGHQLIAYIDGGKVDSGTSGEYGLADLKISESVLLRNLESSEKVWMNHKDIVKQLPPRYIVTATTAHSPIAAYEDVERQIYGVQFHPEVTHTPNGYKVLENFVFGICKASKGWKTSDMVDKICEDIKKTIGEKKAIIGLSGGIDSSTAAILVSKVIGKNLVAVYVDTGLMRYKETEFIREEFSRYDLDLRIIDASERFFNSLKGIVEPEQKRKVIGRLFVEVFDEVARAEGSGMLIQGTIYSDRIESGATKHSSTIKSHHNVGGLPDDMSLEVYEPLKELYKDEVRAIARSLDISSQILNRHVFPGPGLAVRIVGEVTPEKAEIVRRASYIIEQELRKADYYNKVWMAFAVLLSIRSVGIQGDARSYKYPIVVRIIESKDAMTANFSRISYDVLEKISTRITNEIAEVNRVVYDISNKPPATMEWE